MVAVLIASQQAAGAFAHRHALAAVIDMPFIIVDFGKWAAINDGMAFVDARFILRLDGGDRDRAEFDAFYTCQGWLSHLS